MKKNLLVKVLACSMIAMLAAGCAAAPAQETEPAATVEEDPAEGTTETENDSTAEESGESISISFWDGNWNETVFPQIKELWDAQYPDIELTAEFQVDQGMSDKYMMALQTGTAPDVVACALDWVTTFGSAGLLAPLDEYIAADGVDTGMYVQGALDASTIDGQLYGLPFRSETYTLFYNKDLLSAAGYDAPPETWEQVKEMAAAITTEDVAGYGLVGTNFGNFSFQYITMLRSSGGDILNADNTASALNTPEGLKAAQLYKDLLPFAPASVLENDNIANRNLFASGKVAMYMSGIYDAPEIDKANPDLNYSTAMVPVSEGSERQSILGGWSVAIPETCENKEAAWKFVKFITSPEVAKLYTNTFTGTGDPAEAFADYPADILDSNSEALNYAKALPPVAPIVGIRTAIFDNLVLTLTDSATVEDAVAQLSDAVNALLAESE